MCRDGKSLLVILGGVKKSNSPRCRIVRWTPGEKGKKDKVVRLQVDNLPTEFPVEGISADGRGGRFVVVDREEDIGGKELLLKLRVKQTD